jgi:hypothetical protein
MDVKRPVFDRWGNLVGYVTQDAGCGPFGFVAFLLFILPLVIVFYVVNVFRIGRRLLQKGDNLKAIIWFGAFTLHFFYFFFAYLLNSGVNSQLLFNTIMICQVPLACNLAIGFWIQVYLCFKYSDLNF